MKPFIPACVHVLFSSFASLCSAVFLHSSFALAGPRSSANYTVTSDTVSHGGARTTSAAYTNDGSAGGIVGISTVASPAETVKHGHIGQLYDVDHLHINSAPPDSITELGTKQLSLIQILDDGSVLVADLIRTTWTTTTGPVITVDNTGLAHASAVFQDSLTTLRADYEGLSALGQWTILNVNNDDLPGYSGDGLDDAWQVQFFGLNNPLAAPTVDADADGQDNRFEFTAGISPTDPAARFLLNPAPVPAQPGRMNLIISPRLPDRTYTVLTSPTLGTGAVWTPLTGFTTSDNGTTRTITDLDATGFRKFYKVEITNP